MNPPLLRAQRRSRLIGLAVILVLLAAVRLAPLSSMRPICGFKNLTGLPCPLCGGTRAAQCILSGDFPHALYLNPLALPVVAVLVAVALVFFIELLRGRALADWDFWKRRLSPFIPLLVILMLLWWGPHLVSALRGPKPELVDLRNPIARAAYEKFGSKN